MSKTTRSRKRRERLWDVLTGGALILTLIILVYYILIGLQPGSPLNPFSPPTPVALLYIPTAALATPQPAASVTASPAPTTAVPPPARTPTAISAVTFTPTPQGTTTPTLTPQPTLAPTALPTPTWTRSPFTFTATINYQVHPILTCDWSGAAGTVVDLKGRAARGYVVQITAADGTTRRVNVGSSPDYGPGGWEVRLGERQASGAWRIQLYSASNLEPASDAYDIVLPGLCPKNLAFVRFQQNH